MASAVFTGTVGFSTTILLVLETEAITRAAPSQYVRSAALPAPTPRVFVGVFTLQVGFRGSQAGFKQSHQVHQFSTRDRVGCLPHKDNVRFPYMLVHLRAEEQVAPQTSCYNLCQARFWNG